MKDILNEKQIKHIMDELDNLSQYDPIDFSDFDFNEVEKLLRSGPVAQYLPPPNPEYQKHTA